MKITPELQAILEKDANAIVYIGRVPGRPDDLQGALNTNRIPDNLHDFGHAIGQLLWECTKDPKERDELIAGFLCYVLKRKLTETGVGFDLPKGILVGGPVGEA